MAIEWDKNTLLLLHGETLEDSSFYAVPITNNGVQVSTVQSKFGGKSLYFNGAARLTISLSKLGLDFNSDWTMEWWEKPTSNKGFASAVICNKTASNGFVIGAPNGNNIRIFAGTTAWDFISITNIGVYNTDWVHRAVCKKGTKVYAFENGTLMATITTSGTYTPTDEVLIGYRNTSTSAGGYVGYIDEMRISDVARWTSDFTPPTEPYQPSVEIASPELVIPSITDAQITPQMVYVGDEIKISVAIEEKTIILYPEDRYAGEIYAGEV